MKSSVVVADRQKRVDVRRWRRESGPCDCCFHGSPRPSRNRSSPCSVQQIGAFNVRLSGAASPISSELGRLIDVGRRLGRRATRRASRTPCAGTPSSPSSIETVRSPSSCGSVLIRRFAAQLDHPRRHPSRRSSRRGVCRKKRGVLLQVDADAAEEHVVLADVRLVGARRRVDRHQRDVVPAREQLGRQRVVAQAAAAIHARRRRA